MVRMSTTLACALGAVTVAADATATPQLRAQFLKQLELAGTSGCTPGDVTFDNLMLVEQWPGSLGLKVDGFTLHGLWPSRTGAEIANYPCTCTNSKFDIGAVSSIMTQLDTYWPSTSGNNQVFWTHEYEKHGTCAATLPALSTELKFMSTALNLRQQLDTEGTLSKAGITPSATTKYNSADIVKAFDTATIIKCDSSGQLIEVATCFSKAISVIDCEPNAYGGSNCPASVLYPPATGKSPSAAPSPLNQCVPDKHGPKCTTDSDCTSVPDCIRCAESGYCTEQKTL